MLFSHALRPNPASFAACNAAQLVNPMIDKLLNGLFALLEIVFCSVGPA